MNGYETELNKLDTYALDDTWEMHNEDIFFRQGLNSIMVKTTNSKAQIRFGVVFLFYFITLLLL